jgi:hypothetical protein
LTWEIFLECLGSGEAAGADEVLLRIESSMAQGNGGRGRGKEAVEMGDGRGRWSRE